jgi:2-oxoglutarate ferredoxin oxidoreductase subunit beta
MSDSKQSNTFSTASPGGEEASLTENIGKAPVPVAGLTRKDFTSDQEVRWCPGCGDYSILAQVQKVMPELGIPREKIVFVSGIGCSSRFPYYMNTYGFHTIHGRAPAIATGVKAANPDLTVFVVTGDGDGLSIGGNHLMHALRRNVDLKIILFNNQIYGLTKGQYSPTSIFGQRTKSTPMGVIDYPINPLVMALASEATFVARSVDSDPGHLTKMIGRIARHKGAAFLEVYQNCNIFNDGCFDHFKDREVRSDRMIEIEDGAPLVFGKDRKKGIRLNGLRPEVVDLSEGSSWTEEHLLVHDENSSDPTLATLLARMTYPELPVPMGVFRAIERPTYEVMLRDQIATARAKSGPGDLEKLLNSGDTWVVD